MKIKLICFLLTLLIIVNIASCSIGSGSVDLMKGIVANASGITDVTDDFVKEHYKYAHLLTQIIAQNEKGKNILISPLSIQIALTMAASGAEGETKAELEKLLSAIHSIEDTSSNLQSVLNTLKNKKECKFKVGNSIWIRDDKERLTVDKDFLQKSKDYFNADAYKSAFDQSTVKDMNSWASRQTDGMIDKITDEIDSDAVLFILNAIMFDGKWEKEYKVSQVSDGIFNAYDKREQVVSMMSSSENEYIETQTFTGFTKYYKGKEFSFSAILPKDENEDIYQFAKDLSANELWEAVNNAPRQDVRVVMPKFSYQYDIRLNDSLKALGINYAFDEDKADFSSLAKSTKGNIFIKDILHKTFIEVDEKGTKAAAITKIEFADKASPVEPEKSVILDRPFIYIIRDTKTNLPIFIGLVANI